jgi:hypothetical protein
MFNVLVGKNGLGDDDLELGAYILIAYCPSLERLKFCATLQP